MWPFKKQTPTRRTSPVIGKTIGHFVIEPFQGVGPIRFGMHKDEVSHTFTCVFKSFFKGPKSKIRSDDIEAYGLIIHYGTDSRVDYIEIFKPVYATVTLELFGRDITGISVRDAFALLSSHSATFTKAAYGYDFPTLGVSTYNSHLESEDQPVECFGLKASGSR
jgi:hypothetical protein